MFPYSEGDEGSQSKTFVITEPLLHPLCEDSDAQGMSNVRELSITLNFDSILTKMWSSPENVTGLSIDLSSAAPQLLISYVQPKQPEKIPLSLHLGYEDLQVRSTNVGNVDVNATQSVSMNNIVVSQVPSKMYVFARKKNSDKTYNDADSYACIENLNFTLGTRSGILSSATHQQLYNMSVANGLEMSWNQFSRRLGSIVCIDLAKDVGGFQPGAVGNLSSSFTGTIRNKQIKVPGHQEITGTPANTIDYDLFLVLEQDGVFTVSPDNASLSLGLSQADMAEAQQAGEVHENATEGGKIRWNKIGRFGRKMLHGVTSVANTMVPVMPKTPQTMGALATLNAVDQMAGRGLMKA